MGGVRRRIDSPSAHYDRRCSRKVSGLRALVAQPGPARRRHTRELLLRVLHASWEITMGPPLLKAIPQFGHPKFDPCLDGPERLVQSLGNLGMRESFVICEFNRLLLNSHITK